MNIPEYSINCYSDIFVRDVPLAEKLHWLFNESQKPFNEIGIRSLMLNIHESVLTKHLHNCTINGADMCLSVFDTVFCSEVNYQYNFGRKEFKIIFRPYEGEEIWYKNYNYPIEENDDSYSITLTQKVG